MNTYDEIKNYEPTPDELVAIENEPPLTWDEFEAELAFIATYIDEYL